MIKAVGNTHPSQQARPGQAHATAALIRHITDAFRSVLVLRTVGVALSAGGANLLG